MEELIDVLDNQGNETGETILKSEAHKRGLWHKNNHMWLLNSKRELLIQKRTSNKDTYPDHWDISAAGHVSAGEKSVDSAIREFMEELGVKINKRDLIYLGKLTQEVVIRKNEYFENEFFNIYIVEKDIPISEMVMQESEVQDLKYIHWRKLKEMVDCKDKTLVPHDEEYKLLFEYLENKEKNQ